MAVNLFGRKEPYADFVTRWSKESFTMMSGGLDMFNKMNRAWLEMAGNPVSMAPPAPDAFQSFSKGWLDGYSRMYRIWIESAQKIGDSCEAGLQEKNPPEVILKGCSEISQRFAGEWLSFASEQSKSFLRLRECCSPAGKTEP
jgi:hypothetical protein